MKIGVDAFFLSSNHNTGIGNYVLYLLKGLSSKDNNN